MDDKKYEEILRKYLPESALIPVIQLIKQYKISLKIVSERSSKLGDYRCPDRINGHRISINGNINKYHFLLTFLHEVAHLLTWNKYGNRKLPHGKEWKKEFQLLVYDYLNAGTFATDLIPELVHYMKNPSATTSGKITLNRALQKYDTDKVNGFFVDDIPMGNRFILNGREFIKLSKIRTRYKCRAVNDGRIYLVHKAALVNRSENADD
ncbi:MAG: SprT-like domain-containing protein [Bacteroidota bacterium]|nr:SprT-like domain-containing protein [Bacteroidota bacterium]